MDYVGPSRAGDVPPALESPFTHERIQYCFHYDDVPLEIVAADMAPMADPSLGVSGAPWRSAKIPVCAATGTSLAPAGTEAAWIKVPVLVAGGERDVIPDPHREAAAYTGSDDVTIRTVAHMAHMHNFASTRETLWRRLEGWIDSVL